MAENRFYQASLEEQSTSEGISVMAVMGELSPAKLLRIGLEARSPSSRVEVGRVEEVHYGTSDRLCGLSKGQEEMLSVSSEAEYTGRRLRRVDRRHGEIRMQSWRRRQ